MKKILLAVFLFSTVAMIIQACSKDEEMKKEKSLSLYSGAGADETEAKIIKFINRMDLVREDPNYPGSENWNYSEDSTVWYIEAALNYNSSRTYQNLSGSEIYYSSSIDSTSSLIVSSEPGFYGIHNIQIAYDSLNISLSNYYNTILSDNKFFIVDDIIGIFDSSIKMRFVFGYEQSKYSIGDWYWGWAKGMCSGSQQGIDAADVMEQAVNGPYPPNLNVYNPFDYYTNVETSIRIEPINVPVSNNPFGNYMLFQDYQQGVLNHHCLNTPEMGTFISYLPQIGVMYKPNGKIILFYQVKDDTIFGAISDPNNPNNIIDFWYMIHWTKITYGIHHTGITPPPTN